MKIDVSKQDILYLREFQKMAKISHPDHWQDHSEWRIRRDWFDTFMTRFDGKA